MIDIKYTENGLLNSNSYVVKDDENNGVIIDAGASIDELKNIAEIDSLNIRYLVLTHGHIDHIYYINDIVKYFKNIKVLIHKDDIEIINDSGLNCSRLIGVNFTLDCDLEVIDEKYIFKLGKYNCEVISVPGHTPGGMCIRIGENIFTGDTLFAGNVGRADLGRGNMDILIKSIKEKLFVLNDNIDVYPGHGEPTQIGYEKRNNCIR